MAEQTLTHKCDEDNFTKTRKSQSESYAQNPSGVGKMRANIHAKDRLWKSLFASCDRSEPCYDISAIALAVKADA